MDNLTVFALVVIAFVVIIYYWDSPKIEEIKQNGVKVEGTIIENNERQGRFRQLGGNFNDPIVKFNTLDGQEIIGKPVIGFVSQFEVQVPSFIDIIYNSKNPRQFCIDGV